MDVVEIESMPVKVFRT